MRRASTWLLTTARVVLATTTLAITPAIGADQPPPPNRNGNVWSGKDHQPTRADVDTAERRAGTTTPADQARQDGSVDGIAQRLQDLERRYPPGFLQR